MFKRNRKEESYSIKEFMNKGKEKILVPEVVGTPMEFKGEVLESLSWLGTISLVPLIGKPVFDAIKPLKALAAETYPNGIEAVPAVASVSGDKILHAFDPLIELIQAISYPIAMVVVLGGAIMVMIDRKERGFDLMQGAGLGYVLVQMAPVILNILVNAMKAV